MSNDNSKLIIALVLAIAAIPSPVLFGLPFLIASGILAGMGLGSKTQSIRIWSGILLGFDILITLLVFYAFAVAY